MKVKFVIAGHEVCFVAEAETAADRALLGVLAGDGRLEAHVEVAPRSDWTLTERQRLLVRLEPEGITTRKTP